MRLAAQGWSKPWQTLCSIIMSARTRDETTIVGCQRDYLKISLDALRFAAAKIFDRSSLSGEFLSHEACHL